MSSGARAEHTIVPQAMSFRDRTAPTSLHQSNPQTIGSGAAEKMAHELAQPLAAAMNYLSTANALLSAKPSVREDAVADAIGNALACLVRTGAILRQCNRALDPALPKSVDLQAVMDDVMQMFGAEWDIIPEIRLAPGASKVAGDRVQIGQIFSNLIKNAVEAMHGQKVRHLAVKSSVQENGLIQIRIEDDGPGITSDRVGPSFTPVISAKPGGQGIGLAICRAIVEHHDGHLWAERRPTGAAFCFTLPPG